MTRIAPDHLGRQAFVYVRQSTQDQVLHNHESRRRQYALADRARGLGWAEPVVIDDDEHILPNPYSAGELAQVISGYIQVYVKANMFYKEQQELENEKKN